MTIDLTDEVEILDEEDEFEDIETITSLDCNRREAGFLIPITNRINELILNQKKIIEKIKEVK